MYILPVPRHWVEKEGTFLLHYSSCITITAAVTGKLYDYAKLLQEDIKRQLGYAPAISRNKKEKGQILLTLDSELSEEEYRIEIEKENVFLAGGSEQGILYGIQTLRQMISQEGAFLTCCTIKDYPVISNRGYYFDVTRGRIPTLKSLKALADKLSYYKLNQLQLYIEHSYLFEEQSEVWRDDTPLTAQDILELDHYCRHLNIELVPSMSTFGHLYKALRTKSYEAYCEVPEEEKKAFSFCDRMNHHTLDVSNEESFSFITRQMEEFMALFTSGHFNICADETFDLGKGRSKKLEEKEGVQRLYLDYVKRLCEFVIEKGKRPMFWGDIIAGFPQAIKELPEEVICLNWGYSPNQPENETKALYEAKVIQYVCPGVGGWNQFINLYESAYQNISKMCAYAYKYQAIGVLNTDWGDFGHINHPEFSTAGLIYGACFSWNNKQVDFAEINRQISCVEYGDGKEEFLQILSKAGGKSVFDWWQAVMLKEFDNKDTITKDLAEKAKAANLELDQVKTELYQNLVFMKTENRSVIKAYLVALDGMKIFNRIGTIIASRQYGGAEEDGNKLAGELEYWFYDFKEIWRTISRESELYRIAEVILWYADMLRTKGAK